MSASKVIPIDRTRTRLTGAAKSQIPRPSGRVLDQSALEQLVGYNLRRAEIITRQRFIKALSDWSLRPAEFSALVLIANNAEVTPGDLGLALDIKRPNMVTLIARLEHRGLVQREVHHQDRRSQILTLTPKGEAMLADVGQLVVASDLGNTDCWSSQQREQFLRLLQMLIDHRLASKAEGELDESI